MVLAAYMMPLMAGLVVLVSTTKAAELSVPQLEEQDQICKMDLSMNVGLYETSTRWSSSINGDAASTIFVRQTTVCGISTSTSWTARHADAKHIPPTVDGPGTYTTTNQKVFDISSNFAVEGPTDDPTPLDGPDYSDIFGPCPPTLDRNALTIDHRISDTTQVEDLSETTVLEFNRQQTTTPLTIEPLVLDATPMDGADSGRSGSVESNVRLTIDKSPLAKTPTNDAAAFDSRTVAYGDSLTIRGLAVNDDNVDARTSSKSSMSKSRGTQAISAPMPEVRDHEKAALSLTLSTTVPLTIAGPLADETLTEIGISSEAHLQTLSDSGMFTKPVIEGSFFNGGNTSSNKYGSYRTIPLLLPPIHLLNASPPTDFHYTEIRHGILSVPQATISGVVPLGRSPDPVLGNSTLWCFALWYYGIGLLMYFLGQLFPYSSFGRYKDRCYDVVEAVADVITGRFVSLRRWRMCCSDNPLLKTLNDEARGWEIKASQIQDQLIQLHLDREADQKKKNLVIEERQVCLEMLNTKIATLESDKKQSEEDHSLQIATKEQEISLAQKANTTLTEANTLLQNQITQTILAKNELQKTLEDAQTENNRLSKAYRQLCESTNSKVAAGAEKDRKISDLGRQLQSAEAALKKMEAEKVAMNADKEKRITELSRRVEDIKSALEEKTAEVASSKVEADAKVSALESEIQTCRSRLDAKTIEKDVYEANSKRQIVGLKFLLMVFKAVATRQAAEKNACISELLECRSTIDMKTVEIEALKLDQASETLTEVSEISVQVSETQYSQDDNVIDAQSDDCGDGTSSKNTTTNNSADEAHATDKMIDDNAARHSRREAVSSDVVDFARSAGDIFEDSVPSGCKGTVHLTGIPIPCADNWGDGLLRDNLSMRDSADETQATGDLLDENLARLSHCDKGSLDGDDFARSRVDIFEGYGLSGCKATVNLGVRGMVAAKVKADGISPGSQGKTSGSKKDVVKKGGGFPRKNVNKPQRLFRFGPN